MADGTITIKVDAKKLNNLVNSINRADKGFKRATGSAKKLSNVSGNLGARLGFVAFQFTFMAGVAGRALQDIGRRLSEFTQEGASDLSSIGRAISRSGFDIAATFGEEKEAVDLLNDAIRSFGSGATIFTTQEVAEAFNAVGRAVTFTGNSLQRAQQQIIITKNVLNLMTIEEQGAEAAAINLIKTMKQFSLTVQDAASTADVLVAVNNQSSITLDGLVRSLGFAGQQAREFGLTFEETAVILGVIQDRLGVLNGGPGRNFSILLESLSDTTTSLNGVLSQFGINIRDANGKLRPFNSILNEIANALNAAGEEGSLFREVILDQVSSTSRGSRALLALVQGIEEYELSLANLSEAEGLAADLAARFGELPEERIKRLKNAVAQLRVEFVGGLAPVLGQITDALRGVVTDSNVQEFMITLGQAIGSTIIPFVNSMTKSFKFLAAILGKNEFVLKAVTALFIGLVGILGTLFIVGTLGALISVMASSVARLAASTLFLTVVQSVWFLSLLRVLAVMAGIFLVLKAVDNIIGIFKDGIEALELPLLAFNVALGATGLLLVALGTGALTISALKAAVLGLPALLKAIPFALSELGTGGFLKATGKGLGASLSGGFGGAIGGAKGIVGAVRTAISGLSRAGIIGIAIAAAAAIGLGIALELDKRVKNAEVFKTGLVDFWDEAAFQFKAAVSSTLFEIGRFFTDLWRGIVRSGQIAFVELQNIFANTLRNISIAFEKAKKFDFGGALAALLTPVIEINFDEIATGFAETFNNKLLAENRIREIAAKLFEREGQDFLNIDDIFNRPEFQEILAATKTAGILSPEDIINLINESLGLAAFDPITGEALMDALTSQIASVEESVGITDTINASLTEYDKELKKLVDSGEITKKEYDAIINSTQILTKTQNDLNDVDKILTTEIGTNTGSIETSTGILNQLNTVIRDMWTPIIFQQMQQMLVVEGELNLLEDDLSNLRSAIVGLTNRIARTNVKFKKNDEGDVVGFKLVGGVSKAEANSGFNFFDSGGIVTGPTAGILGEKGPEAIIPLSRLENNGGFGVTVGDINITVEGNADEDTAQDIADAVAEVINNSIPNKPILR